MISRYFDKIKREIEKFSHIIENYQFVEKIYSEERGLIGAEITFINNSRLDFAEVKDIEQTHKIKYRYHYQDANDVLIFRYDNSKHHNELKTFPHHKHYLGNILESSEPDLKTVLFEIESFVLKKSAAI